MKLFVYGTLKKGAKNHFFLKDALFIGYKVLGGYSLYDIEHGFPLMFEDSGGSVYGEVYEINDSTLHAIDALEGEGKFYKREYDSKLDMYYYVTMNKDRYEDNYYNLNKVESGFWKEFTDRKYSVMIDNRLYIDTPDKLVFHMRFFDGRRAPTNKIYMDLVKKRSHKDLNTINEEIFIVDCIMNGVITNVEDRS